MPEALSTDLRKRVVAAIEAGASRRQATTRFGVGAASAIRWHAAFRQEGRVAPKPMGGDRCSHRLEAHAAVILRTPTTSAPLLVREQNLLVAVLRSLRALMPFPLLGLDVDNVLRSEARWRVGQQVSDREFAPAS